MTMPHCQCHAFLAAWRCAQPVSITAVRGSTVDTMASWLCAALNELCNSWPLNACRLDGVCGCAGPEKTSSALSCCRRGKRGQKHYTVFVCSMAAADRATWELKLNSEHRFSHWFGVQEAGNRKDLHPVVALLYSQMYVAELKGALEQQGGLASLQPQLDAVLERHTIPGSQQAEVPLPPL